jgi:hypothetical protein
MKTVNESEGKKSKSDLTLAIDEKPRQIKGKFFSAKHGEAIKFVHANGHITTHWT